MYSSEICDCIGMEICTGFKSDLDSTRRREEDFRGETRRRAAEYPPPIQRRVNVTRYTTEDGRLIITKEKIQRHEYFQVDRWDGRLVLRIVNVTDDDEEEEEEKEEEEEAAASEEEMDGGDMRDRKRVWDLTTVVDLGVYYERGVNNCGGFTVTVETAPLRSPVHT